MIGSRIGPFEIRSKIGAGGMGEVYRAYDTRLDRDVAIKILPASFAADPDRLARFDREARTLASLNHPNIAHVHGVEESPAAPGHLPTRAIVMELVEGDDLAQRLIRGPVPIAEALAIARQTADALQAAHDHGIIHRDLKPANVKVRPDGTVKLLDFGLAKVTDRQGADGALSHSPTAMASMPGVLLGTAAYMSPEQVKGQTADARADVWAFGCLLYEMLTGRPAFAGPTLSEIFADVLTAEPAWGALPRDTPEAVHRLLGRCLQKNASVRLRALGDARLEIDDAANRDTRSAPSSSGSTFRRERMAWTAAVIVLSLVALGAGWLAWSRPAATPPAEVRFDMTNADVVDPFLLNSFAISPDERQVLYVAEWNGQPHVWIRPFDSSEARPLPGTGGGVTPFWSPDGRSIAFYADGFLKRLDLEGGLVRALAKATVGISGTWSRSGVILFVRNPASAIVRVSADGGPATTVTRMDAGHVGHTFPHFLPDGRHFLYYVVSGPDARGIHVGDTEGSPARRLLDADGAGLYANRSLLFTRQSTIFAQPFDPDRLELTGSPAPVADSVYGRPAELLFFAAVNTTMAFRVGEARFARQFMWVDRAGTPIASIGERLGNPDGVSYAPDRSQLVYFERGPAGSDLWILDTRRGVVSRFTDEADEDIFPLWARDGQHIVYTVIQKGQIALVQRHIATGVKSVVLAPQSQEVFASDVTPDGKNVIYQRMDPATGFDIWSTPLADPGSAGSEARPVPLVQTDADERSARLSPDGRWLAYVSNTSGISEVYVQPFPRPGRRVQVSAKGGDQPQWQANGAELFYIAMDGKLTSATVAATADGQSLEIGAPTPLFVAGVGSAVTPVLAGHYGAAPDGKRFLLNRLVRDAVGPPLRVILNWAPRSQAP
jgi:serine/threonine protein kinase